MSQCRDPRLLVNIALALKSLREAKKLTQEEVFNELKIHIGRIETGKTNISISTLQAICDFYDISLKDFFSISDFNSKN